MTMTLKNIKEKIYALLDIDTGENSPQKSVYISVEKRINSVIDTVGRKLTLYTKSIKKSCELDFEYGSRGSFALLPTDFAAFSYILCGGVVYTRDKFEIIGGNIYGKEISIGKYTLVYYAYTPHIDSESDNTMEFCSDLYLADTICYGAAMEICTDIYPEDMTRFMRLATEYDERLINILTSAGEITHVTDGLFCGSRGIK